MGAGPSGLFAALELARHGVPSRVVERAPEPHREARATGVQPATLEILACAGVAETVLASSAHLRASRLVDARLQLLSEIAFAGIGCKWEFMCNLPQWRTEEILTARLMELGGSVERGVGATSLDLRADGVVVSLEHGDGTVERVEAEWVIGAGGAHSITRESMHERLVGDTYPGTVLVADARVDCPLSRDAIALVAGKEGYVGLAPLTEQRWLTFVGDLDDDEVGRLAGENTVSVVQAAIQRRVKVAVRVEDVAWASEFRMHRRMAPRLADGRRFLLGDAGHLSSPFGGEGMNSGLQDANNLAWKLALLLRGRGRPQLAASFAEERLAADHHVLDVSDRLHRLVHDAVEGQRTGTRKPPLTADEATELARARAMLDVSYVVSPIVGEHVGSQDALSTPRPGERHPDRAEFGGTRHHLSLFGAVDEAALADLERRWGSLIEVMRDSGDPARSGLRSEGAVLVRPDGFIGFRAAPADAAGLQALDVHLDSYLVPD